MSMDWNQIYNLYSRGEIAQATAILNDASQHGLHVDSYCIIALIFLEAGRPDAARDVLAQIQRLSATFNSVFFLSVQDYINKGKTVSRDVVAKFMLCMIMQQSDAEGIVKISAAIKGAGEPVRDELEPLQSGIAFAEPMAFGNVLSTLSATIVREINKVSSPISVTVSEKYQHVINRIKLINRKEKKKIIQKKSL